jgi:Sugar (and other) transporter
MVDGILVEFFPESGWRAMLGLAMLPAMVMFYGFLSLPESPRWLAQQGRVAEASKILQSLRESDEEAAAELAEIVQSVDLHRHDEGESDDENDNDENMDGDKNEECHDDDETALEHGTAPIISTPDAHAHRPRHNSHNPPHHHHHHSFLFRFGQMVADRPTRRALVLGCGLMVVQQCSGINTYVWTLYC